MSVERQMAISGLVIQPVNDFRAYNVTVVDGSIQLTDGYVHACMHSGIVLGLSPRRKIGTITCVEISPIGRTHAPRRDRSAGPYRVFDA